MNIQTTSKTALSLPGGHTKLILEGRNRLQGANNGIKTAQAGQLDIHGPGSLTVQAGSGAIDTSNAPVYLHSVDGMALTAWAGDDIATATKLAGTGGAVPVPVQYKTAAPYFYMEYTPFRNLAVTDGSSGGSYLAGGLVSMNADRSSGRAFHNWIDEATGNPLIGVTFLNGTSAASPQARFEIPAHPERRNSCPE